MNVLLAKLAHKFISFYEVMLITSGVELLIPNREDRKKGFVNMNIEQLWSIFIDDKTFSYVLPYLDLFQKLFL